MTSNFLSALSLSAGSNVPMAILLTKATIILLLALGMTVVMQRASAGARHLVWLVSVAALLFVPALTAWGPLPGKVLPAVSSVPDRWTSIAGSKSQNVKTVKADNSVVTAPSSGQVAAPSENGVNGVMSESGL